MMGNVTKIGVLKESEKINIIWSSVVAAQLQIINPTKEYNTIY
jgi:hypothetical protein